MRYILVILFFACAMIVTRTVEHGGLLESDRFLLKNFAIEVIYVCGAIYSIH